MVFITIVGLLAAVLTTASTFPQALKSWKTRKTDDISLFMYVLLTVGVLLWLVYGILISDLPVILANAVGLVTVSTVLMPKLKYG